MKTPPARWFVGGWRRRSSPAGAPEAAPEYWALTAEQLLARLGSGSMVCLRPRRTPGSCAGAEPAWRRPLAFPGSPAGDAAAQPAAAPAGVRRRRVGAHRRVARRRHRARDRRGQRRRSATRASTAPQTAAAAFSAQVRIASHGPARRPCRARCRSRRSCQATSCCCRRAAWFRRDARRPRGRPTSSSARPSLTGESFPVEKSPGQVRRWRRPCRQRTNCVFLGTNVRSGTARCLVVATGPATEFGAIAHRLTLRAAGDRVRPRHPPLRLPAHERHAGAGAARVRGARVPRASAGRDAAVLHRARGGPEPGAAAGDPERQPGARRPDDGAARRARAAPERHREPRQHGRAVHRQDRHAHRRASCSSRAPTTPRAAPSNEVLDLAA